MDAGHSPALGDGLGRAAQVVVGVVAVLTLSAAVASLEIGRGWLWGADAYAFLPRVALGCGLAGVAVVVLGLLRGRPRPASSSPAVDRAPGGRFGVRVALGAVAAGLLFWVFRTRHVLLGDGIPITTLLPDEHLIHPRQPLSQILQQGLYHALRHAFERPGIDRAQVIQDCVAVGSVVAGILFVGVAWMLAGEIVRSFPAREPESARRLAVVVMFVLLAQGYVQLFFGYVEYYALSVVVAGLYVAAGLRFLRGGGGILGPLFLVAFAVALDFKGVVLGPSAFVLAVVGLLDGRRRRTVVRDLMLVVGVVLIVVVVVMGPMRYPVATHLMGMLASGAADTSYLLSMAHLRDLLNEHLLIGPFGLFLFLPVAVLAWRRAQPRPAVAFLVVAGLSAAWACWSASDLPMGYARDWDLFGPLGVVLSTAAVALTMSLIRDARARWRTVAIVAAASLFHTAPWIALNTSEARSLERFKTLPLGGGRTETTVAYWYAQHADRLEAKRWLKKALAINPDNSRALDLYGRIGFEENDARLALQAYLIAVALRPDKTDFRSQLAAAVDAAGGPAAGLRHLDTLMAGRQDNGALWLLRAMLLRADGRITEAIQAKSRASRLRPDLASADDSLPTLPAGRR